MNDSQTSYIHSPNTKLCPICKGDFSTVQFEKHFKNCSKRGAHLCPECRKTSGKQQNNFSQLKKCNDRRLYSCDLCGKLFKYGTDLIQMDVNAMKMSLMTELQELQYTSLQETDGFSGNQFRENEFAENPVYSKDEMDGNAEIDHVSDDCEPDGTAGKAEMNSETTHLKDEKSCADEGKIPSVVGGGSKRRSDRGKSTGGKNHKCSECDKSFTKHSSLIRHKRLHGSQSPFVCHLCQTHFKHYSSLTRHINKRRCRGLPKWENDVLQKTVEPNNVSTKLIVLEEATTVKECYLFNNSDGRIGVGNEVRFTGNSKDDVKANQDSSKQSSVCLEQVNEDKRSVSLRSARLVECTSIQVRPSRKADVCNHRTELVHTTETRFKENEISKRNGHVSNVNGEKFIGENGNMGGINTLVVTSCSVEEKKTGEETANGLTENHSHFSCIGKREKFCIEASTEPNPDSTPSKNSSNETETSTENAVRSLTTSKNSSNKNLNCQYCGKVFSKRSVLQKHVRSHVNEWPFACHLCSQEFKYQSSLSRHVKEQHFGGGRKLQGTLTPHVKQTRAVDDLPASCEEDVCPSMVVKQRWLHNSDLEIPALVKYYTASSSCHPMTADKRESSPLRMMRNLSQNRDVLPASSFGKYHHQSLQTNGLDRSGSLPQNVEKFLPTFFNKDLYHGRYDSVTDSSESSDSEKHVPVSCEGSFTHEPLKDLSFIALPRRRLPGNEDVDVSLRNDSLAPECSVFQHWKAQHYDSGRQRSGWSRIAGETARSYKAVVVEERSHTVKLEEPRGNVEQLRLQKTSRNLPSLQGRDGANPGQERQFSHKCDHDSPMMEEREFKDRVERFQDVSGLREGELGEESDGNGEIIVKGENGDLGSSMVELNDDSGEIGIYKVDSKPCEAPGQPSSETVVASTSKVKGRTRSHACNICGKVFYKRHELRKHWIVHSDERSFACKICSKYFKYKGSLIRHIKEQHYGLGRKEANRLLAGEILREMNNFVSERSMEGGKLSGEETNADAKPLVIRESIILGDVKQTDEMSNDKNCGEDGDSLKLSEGAKDSVNESLETNNSSLLRRFRDENLSGSVRPLGDAKNTIDEMRILSDFPADEIREPKKCDDVPIAEENNNKVKTTLGKLDESASSVRQESEHANASGLNDEETFTDRDESSSCKDESVLTEESNCQTTDAKLTAEEAKSRDNLPTTISGKEALRKNFVLGDGKKSKQFSCKKCPKSYTNEYQLRRHKCKSGNVETTHCSCHICGLTFKHRGSKSRHIKEQHFGLLRKKSLIKTEKKPDDDMDSSRLERDNTVAEVMDSINCENTSIKEELQDSFNGVETTVCVVDDEFMLDDDDTEKQREFATNEACSNTEDEREDTARKDLLSTAGVTTNSAAKISPDFPLQSGEIASGQSEDAELSKEQDDVESIKKKFDLASRRNVKRTNGITLSNSRTLPNSKKKSSLYRCNQCDNVFTHMYDFLTHQRIHK